MRRTRAVPLLLLLGAVLGACSASGAGGVATGTPAAVATPAATPAATTASPAATTATTPAAPAGRGAYGTPDTTAAPASGSVAIKLGDTTLGKVIVDGAGKTLYVFTPDSGGKSVCNGDCAASWPPLVGAGAPTLGTGLDAADFASIKRDDGSTQVTFYGMPLYYFAGDAAAGDVKGQGLGGKWYVVDGSGKLIR